jgi:hypothetical protein
LQADKVVVNGKWSAAGIRDIGLSDAPCRCRLGINMTIQKTVQGGEEKEKALAIDLGAGNIKVICSRIWKGSCAASSFRKTASVLINRNAVHSLLSFRTFVNLGSSLLLGM